MIIKKKLIEKIVKEEIKNALQLTKKLKKDRKPKVLDSLRRELINLFIKYRDIVETNPVAEKENIIPKFRKELNSIKNIFDIKLKSNKFDIFCLSLLEDHADPQLITFARNLINSDKMHADKMDNYTMSITPEEEKNMPTNLPFKNIRSPSSRGDTIDDVRRFRTV